MVRPHVHAGCDLDRRLYTSGAHFGWTEHDVVGHTSHCRNIYVYHRRERGWHQLLSAGTGTYEYADIHDGRYQAPGPGNTRCFELGARIRLPCADTFGGNVGWVCYPIKFGTEYG